MSCCTDIPWIWVRSAAMNSGVRRTPHAGQDGGLEGEGRPGTCVYSSKGLRCARHVSARSFRRVARAHFSSSNQSALGSQQ
eukprot:6176655-Pleurochrysis_carterae.AAC.5